MPILLQCCSNWVAVFFLYSICLQSVTCEFVVRGHFQALVSVAKSLSKVKICPLLPDCGLDWESDHNVRSHQAPFTSQLLSGRFSKASKYPTSLPLGLHRAAMGEIECDHRRVVALNRCISVSVFYVDQVTGFLWALLFSPEKMFLYTTKYCTK